MSAPIARKDDPVGHSWSNAVAMWGFDVVVAVTIIATVTTGGGAAVVATRMAKLLSLAKALNTAGDLSGFVVDVAQYVGGLFSKSETGAIQQGSDNVFAGSLPVARLTDKVKCRETYLGILMMLNPYSIGGKLAMLHGTYRALKAGEPYMPGDHPGADIVSGAKTVFTNDLPTARIGSKTVCGGEVVKGLTTVMVGGPDTFQTGKTDVSEINPLLLNTVWLVDWVGAIAGVVTDKLPEAAIGLAKLIVKATLPEPAATAADFGLTLGEFLLNPSPSKLDKVLLAAKGVKYDSTLGDDGPKPPPPKPHSDDWRSRRRQIDARPAR